MDRQESKLRAQLQGTGVSVTRSGDNIVLNMPGNITFATGSADLNANFFGVLDSVALVLKEYDKTIIDVAGHTDSVGSDQTNQALVRASRRHGGHVSARQGRARTSASPRSASARRIRSRPTTRRMAASRTAAWS